MRAKERPRVAVAVLQGRVLVVPVAVLKGLVLVALDVRGGHAERGGAPRQHEDAELPFPVAGL